MSVLSKPYFHDEQAAFDHLESIVWPDGPFCPHCGGMDRIYDLKKTRLGLKKCGHCRKQFTVRVGTVFESSHVPLHKWFQAVYLMCASKKGISSHQLHRTLEVTYKTAWFMAHRIREAMRGNYGPPLGGEGKIVEVDETYIGKIRGRKTKTGGFHKQKVLTLVERGGNTRSFPIKSASMAGILPVMVANIKKETRIMTDDAAYYKNLRYVFDGHDAVNHSAGEYGRGEIHTNTIEGFFSIFKRGMKGIYQHCSEKHLHRYLAEFDFRYNHRGLTDNKRKDVALSGIIGKRLTYRPAH